MIYNILFYGVIINSLNICFYLFMEYLSDDTNYIKRMKEHGETVLYWIGDKILSIKIMYDDNIKKNIMEVINTYFIRNTLFSYNNMGELCKTKATTRYKKVINKNKELYIRSDIKRIKSFKPFLDITIEVKDEYNKVHKLSIEKELSKFFIVGHELDKYFFKAFLKHFYSLSINSSNTYTLHAIDKYCNSIEFTDREKIKIHDSEYLITPSCNVKYK